MKKIRTYLLAKPADFTPNLRDNRKMFLCKQQTLYSVSIAKYILITSVSKKKILYLIPQIVFPGFLFSSFFRFNQTISGRRRTHRSSYRLECAVLRLITASFLMTLSSFSELDVDEEEGEAMLEVATIVVVVIMLDVDFLDEFSSFVTAVCASSLARSSLSRLLSLARMGSICLRASARSSLALMGSTCRSASARSTRWCSDLNESDLCCSSL